MRLIEDIRDDVLFALRQLRRAPAFTMVAVATLALGIGANSAIFALVDATLLRPLPFPNPDRLVLLSERTATAQRTAVPPLDMLDWNDRNRTFDLIAGFRAGVGGMVMNGSDGIAETVSRQWVTAGIFDVLGVKAIAGRTFLDSDDTQNLNVAVLSEGFWRTRFNGDLSVVGREIRFDGLPYTVVGVVPKGFQLMAPSSMWAIMPINSRRPMLRSVNPLRVIGRIKPGVAVDAATADLTRVSEDLAREFPETNKNRRAVVEPLHDVMIGSDLRVTSMLFLGVVGFVLLICCANVANLLLARATVRTRELALRSALGAARSRLVRQLIVESLVLSVIGGVLGMGIGAAILRAAPSVIPDGLLPSVVTLTFDLRVVIFCAAAALVVGLLFGLAPAWQGTHFSAAQAMAAESRSVTGRGGRLRSLLVVGEVATAVVLLFGAGLLLRTLLAVDGVDRGYRADEVLSMLVDPLGSEYPSEASLLQFLDNVEQEVRALPGVSSVAWSSGLPMGPSYGIQTAFEIMGEPPVADNARPTADYQITSASYFETLDLPVVAGRGFNDLDTSTSPPVCIVNEAFARAYLKDGSPVGRRIALRPPGSPQAPPTVREIIGVARQVKARPDETADFFQIYAPMAQNPLDDIYMVVRPKAGPASALAPSVRAAIGRIDKKQLVSVREVVTLNDIVQAATARHRFRAVMVMTFAVLALLLAMVGVFGILAYSVQQRIRDFAVRRALGATSADVLRLVIGSAVRVIVAGTAIGLLLSAFAGRLLAAMLYGVQPLDPMTFVLVSVVMAVTAALSTAAPAWRAAHVDPAVALRGE